MPEHSVETVPDQSRQILDSGHEVGVRGAWGTGAAALWVGALGTLLSGLLMLFAKPVAQLEH